MKNKLSKMNDEALWAFSKRRRHHNKTGRLTIKKGNNRYRLLKIAKELGTTLL